MRSHPMLVQLRIAERMVDDDDAVELLACLEGWRFGPAPHVRARLARLRHARGLPRAPSVSASELRARIDDGRVWEVLGAALEAHAP